MESHVLDDQLLNCAFVGSVDDGNIKWQCFVSAKLVCDALRRYELATETAGMRRADRRAVPKPTDMVGGSA